MYLFELITRWINPKRKFYKKDDFDPFVQEDIENPDNCEHIFLPIDSSGETLACSLCGLVVNKKDLKDINIFKRKK